MRTRAEWLPFSYRVFAKERGRRERPRPVKVFREIPFEVARLDPDEAPPVLAVDRPDGGRLVYRKDADGFMRASHHGSLDAYKAHAREGAIPPEALEASGRVAVDDPGAAAEAAFRKVAADLVVIRGQLHERCGEPTLAVTASRGIAPMIYVSPPLDVGPHPDVSRLRVTRLDEAARLAASLGDGARAVGFEILDPDAFARDDAAEEAVAIAAAVSGPTHRADFDLLPDDVIGTVLELRRIAKTSAEDVAERIVALHDALRRLETDLRGTSNKAGEELASRLRVPLLRLETIEMPALAEEWAGPAPSFGL